MPFTPAHAAIVLPFLRVNPGRISATGLVIGTLAPDFEYFFKMSVNSVHSHTIPGILYFDIPVVIFLSFLFHQVIKKNLIANLPPWFQQKLLPIKEFNFINYFRNHFVVFIVSAGIGSVTHIGWDAFTHNNGFFAQRIDIYKQVFIPIDGVNYPLFYFLQQLSTVVGLLAIAVYFYVIKPDVSIRPERPNLFYWLCVITISVCVVWLRFFLSPDQLELGNFVVSVISALLLGLTISGFFTFNTKRL
jgi:hypothetical protein